MADERVVPSQTDPVNLQKHIARYNLALRACKDKEVLDIACGTGYGTEMISWVAKSVVGVDISEYAVDYAKNHYHANKFIVGDLVNFSMGKYDVIVSFETIEHIKDLELAQKSLDQLLRPGGAIFYSVPLYESYHNEFHYHRFDVEKGLSLFPSYTKTSFVIQKGVNFFSDDLGQPFTYLIVSKIKPL